VKHVNIIYLSCAKQESCVDFDHCSPKWDKIVKFKNCTFKWYLRYHHTTVIIEKLRHFTR